MGELRALKRASSSVRRRGEQDRLAIPVGGDEVAANVGRIQSSGRTEGFRRPTKKSSPLFTPEPPQCPAPISHPLAYRGMVAEWSLENRERWGRRANELEEAGLPWSDAETRAYLEIWLHLHKPNAEAEFNDVEDDLS